MECMKCVYQVLSPHRWYPTMRCAIINAMRWVPSWRFEAAGSLPRSPSESSFDRATKSKGNLKHEDRKVSEPTGGRPEDPQVLPHAAYGDPDWEKRMCERTWASTWRSTWWRSTWESTWAGTREGPNPWVHQEAKIAARPPLAQGWWRTERLQKGVVKGGRQSGLYVSVRLTTLPCARH